MAGTEEEAGQGKSIIHCFVLARIQEMLAILMTATAILHAEGEKSKRTNGSVNSADWAGKCSEAHPHFPPPHLYTAEGFVCSLNTLKFSL